MHKHPLVTIIPFAKDPESFSTLGLITSYVDYYITLCAHNS